MIAETSEWWRQFGIYVVLGLLLTKILRRNGGMFGGAARRRRHVQRVASGLGMRFSDRIGLAPGAFTLCEKGWFSNAIRGEYEGVRVLVADWAFPVDDKGAIQTYSIGWARAGPLPYCSIRRRLAGALSQHFDLAVGTSIGFESETFNREFLVSADDPAFANALVDARMMEWLMSQEEEWVFETGQGGTLIAAPRISPDRYPVLIAGAVGFAKHLPDVLTASSGGASSLIESPRTYRRVARLGNALVGATAISPLHPSEMTSRSLRSPHGKRLAIRSAANLVVLLGYAAIAFLTDGHKSNPQVAVLIMCLFLSSAILRAFSSGRRSVPRN